MSRDGWTLHADADLQACNTLALSARARWLAQIHVPEALPALLAQPQLRGLNRRILGGGSNLLLPQMLDALVLQADFGSLTCHELDPQTLEVVADAGLNWNALVHWSVQQGWRGLENLALIPGQTGAAPIQNIGAYGVELADSLQWVEWLELDSGKLIRMPRADLQLGYRSSLFKQLPIGSFMILRVCLRLHRNSALQLSYAGIAEELAHNEVDQPQAADVYAAVCALRKRKLPDPATQPNVGSFFHNPRVSAAHASHLLRDFPGIAAWPQAAGDYKISAAWLIERCGYKGLQLGNAAVAAQHALVLVNAGGANVHDILALAARIQMQVRAMFAVELEIEPQRW
jgi:UDP-N-acetylmuramate dehydrogenase